MKSLLIRTNGPLPPAGYEFQDPIIVDPITNKHKRYKDTHTRFNERVKEIIRDRLANRRLLTSDAQLDPELVAEELSEYTCRRLNGNPRFCSGGATANAKAARRQALAVESPKVLNRPCTKCGSLDLRPIYCPTCSALKITGWKCNACGIQLPP